MQTEWASGIVPTKNLRTIFQSNYNKMSVLDANHLRKKRGVLHEVVAFIETWA